MTTCLDGPVAVTGSPGQRMIDILEDRLVTLRTELIDRCEKLSKDLSQHVHCARENLKLKDWGHAHTVAHRIEALIFLIAELRDLRDHLAKLERE